MNNSSIKEVLPPEIFVHCIEPHIANSDITSAIISGLIPSLSYNRRYERLRSMFGDEILNHILYIYAHNSNLWSKFEWYANLTPYIPLSYQTIYYEREQVRDKREFVLDMDTPIVVKTFMDPDNYIFRPLFKDIENEITTTRVDTYTICDREDHKEKGYILFNMNTNKDIVDDDDTTIMIKMKHIMCLFGSGLFFCKNKI